MLVRFEGDGDAGVLIDDIEVDEPLGHNLVLVSAPQVGVVRDAGVGLGVRLDGEQVPCCGWLG